MNPTATNAVKTQRERRLIESLNLISVPFRPNSAGEFPANRAAPTANYNEKLRKKGLFDLPTLRKVFPL
jgi:hypothetical protein